MTTPTTLEVAARFLQLERSLEPIDRPGDLDGLLAVYFASGSVCQSEIACGAVIDPADWLQDAGEIGDSAPALAILGSLLFFQALVPGVRDREGHRAFARGVGRLRGRQEVFSQPSAWALQPDILLGITLGLVQSRDTDAVNWLFGLATEALARSDVPLFTQLIYAHAALDLLLSDVGSSGSEALRLEPQRCSVAELALVSWLLRRGSRAVSVGRDLGLGGVCSLLVSSAAQQTAPDGIGYKTALVYVALRDCVSAPKTIRRPRTVGPSDTARLRKGLAPYDDVMLDTLCMDHFPEVYDRFSRGLRRDEKINLLLDHCRRRPEAVRRLSQLTAQYTDE